MGQELTYLVKVRQAQEVGSGDLYLFINVKSHELFKRSDEKFIF